MCARTLLIRFTQTDVDRSTKSGVLSEMGFIFCPISLNKGMMFAANRL